MPSIPVRTIVARVRMSLARMWSVAVFVAYVAASTDASLAAPSDTSVRDVRPFVTYSVLDVGNAHAPHLSKRQLAWLALIHCSERYRAAWKYLRYNTSATADDKPGTWDFPLLVYDRREEDPSGGGAEVIGGPCDIRFDVFERGLDAVPADASCPDPSGPFPTSRTCRRSTAHAAARPARAGAYET